MIQSSTNSDQSILSMNGLKFRKGMFGTLALGQSIPRVLIFQIVFLTFLRMQVNRHQLANHLAIEMAVLDQSTIADNF